MKLTLMCLSISFAIINMPITAMKVAGTKNEAQAYINKKLHIAIELRDLDKVKKLIEKKNADVNNCDTSGFTPLLSAIYKGSWDIVKYLLIRSDTKVNIADPQRWTPLYAASFQGASETVEKLLEKGADINLRTNNGITAGDIALVQRSSSSDSVMKEKYTKIISMIEAHK